MEIIMLMSWDLISIYVKLSGHCKWSINILCCFIVTYTLSYLVIIHLLLWFLVVSEFSVFFHIYVLILLWILPILVLYGIILMHGVQISLLSLLSSYPSRIFISRTLPKQLLSKTLMAYSFPKLVANFLS